MLIFVCSPMRGDKPYSTVKYNRHMRAAADYTRTVIEAGHLPITPHLYLERVLDDQEPADREKGMAISRQFLEMCDEIWVFDENGVSEGMKSEIELASKLGKQVRYKEQARDED